jgi:hypothetical protein
MLTLQFIPGTKVEFGKEKTAVEYMARAKWERAAAKQACKTPCGEVLAEMHTRTAKAYERLALGFLTK